MISVCTAEHVSTQAQRLVRVRVRRETDWARCASLRKQGESPQIMCKAAAYENGRAHVAAPQPPARMSSQERGGRMKDLACRSSKDT